MDSSVLERQLAKSGSLEMPVATGHDSAGSALCSGPHQCANGGHVCVRCCGGPLLLSLVTAFADTSQPCSRRMRSCVSPVVSYHTFTHRKVWPERVDDSINRRRRNRPETLRQQERHICASTIDARRALESDCDSSPPKGRGQTCFEAVELDIFASWTCPESSLTECKPKFLRSHHSNSHRSRCFEIRCRARSLRSQDRGAPDRCRCDLPLPFSWKVPEHC